MNYEEALVALHERYAPSQSFAEELDLGVPDKRQEKQNQDAKLGAPDKPEGGKEPTPGGGDSAPRPPKQAEKQPPMGEEEGGEEPNTPAEDALLNADFDKKYDVVSRAKARLQGLKTEFQHSTNSADKRRVYKMIIGQMIKMSDLME